MYAAAAMLPCGPLHMGMLLLTWSRRVCSRAGNGSRSGALYSLLSSSLLGARSVHYYTGGEASVYRSGSASGTP